MDNATLSTQKFMNKIWDTQNAYFINLKNFIFKVLKVYKYPVSSAQLQKDLQFVNQPLQIETYSQEQSSSKQFIFNIHIQFKILLLQNSYLSTTTETYIYSAGDNTFGQDAINSKDQRYVTNFKQIEQSTFDNKIISKVVLGRKSNFLITTDGYLYAAGSNLKQKLGLPNIGDNYYKYQLVQYFVDNKIKIQDIGAGDDDTVALDNNGNAYSLGQDYFNNDTNQQIYISKIPSNDKFVQVIAYRDTYVLLGQSGKIYFYGNPLQGWSKFYNQSDYTELVQLPEQDFTPSSISLGKNQLFVITTSNQIYVSGKPSSEDSCLGGEYNSSELFNKVNHDFNVHKIAQGYDHTLMLSSEGDVYGCGKNSQSQLGNIATSITVPTKINQDIDDIIDIAATNYGSFIMQDDELYSVGQQDYGELCFQDQNPKQTQDTWQEIDLQHVDIDEINNIVAGQSNSLIYKYKSQTNKLSSSAIAGIVIGCLFGIVIIITIVYFTYHYCKKQKEGIYSNFDSQAAQFGEEW